MEIRDLGNIDFETLFQGFENAFSDYEIRFQKDEVYSMLKRRGYNPQLSFAAFDNRRIVAFALNGTGRFNGLPTAYDTGTGTVKEYRGQGLAGRILSYSIPLLKEAGIRQYLLEVLQNNSKAISVYRRSHFEVTREFDCFRQAIGQVECPDGDAGCVVMPVDVGTIIQAQKFFDIRPSWQNSIDSIARAGSDITCLGAFISGEMIGFCAFDIRTGDLSQIAVDGRYRRKGIASRLLREALMRFETDFVKILNIDSGYPAMHAFLESRNIHVASRQYEMLLPLQ